MSIKSDNLNVKRIEKLLIIAIIIFPIFGGIAGVCVYSLIKEILK